MDDEKAHTSNGVNGNGFNGTAHYDDSKLKKSSRGVTLIPQPSDDPQEPLNWSLGRKILVLAIVSFASLIGISQALANQADYPIQAAVYHKTPTQLSYSVTAAIVGLATGPVLLWAPLARYIGRTPCIFWGMLLTLFMNIWSAEMTAEDDYVPFIISKWLSGTFGSVASTIGGGVIIDVFFLHQRGKAFACYTIVTLFGTQFGGTFSGFIVNSSPWPIQFWWCVAAEGLVAILVFFFLEETTYTPEESQRKAGRSWISNRIRSITPGMVPLPRESHAAGPFASILIGLCPVTILAGGFLLIVFAWTVAINTLLAVSLQTPVAEGGYGFTPLANAEFTFCTWVATLLAWSYGLLLQDRIPLAMCRRRGGVWKPELRLFPLLAPPLIVLPIGLGIYGAGLQYHLHYMVLALGVFLVHLAELSMVPIVFNYVAESFINCASETTTIMNFYRLVLGTVIPFFINPWIAAVGKGWVYGMQAFFVIFATSFPVVLFFKGPSIRELSFARFKKSDDGAEVLK